MTGKNTQYYYLMKNDVPVNYKDTVLRICN